MSLDMKKNSFSLIEVVISVGIFLLVIGSLIAISLVNSRNLVMSKHRLVAVNLAREAAEETVQIRDTFWLNDSNWGNISGSSWGLSPGNKKVCGLGVDPTCVINPNASHLYLESTGGSITLPAIDGVSYTRSIIISRVDLAGAANNDFRKVTVQVSWNDFGALRRATVVTYLTNWKQ
jgi:type II secretory pathway pseudopilin PulG